MPYLNRFTIDVVTEEPLSERRQQTISREMSEWVHLLGVETEDEMVNVNDKFAHGHTHDTTEDRCRQCNYFANDSKNGNSVADS